MWGGLVGLVGMMAIACSSVDETVAGDAGRDVVADVVEDSGIAICFAVGGDISVSDSVGSDACVADQACGLDATVDDVVPVVDACADGPCVEDTYVPVDPPVSWGPQNRGYTMMMGIVHLHSYWSHDGCFSDHEGIDPTLFDVCLAEMREAPCRSGIDFMFQTDHPSDLRNATFEQAVHYQPGSGDVLVNDDQDRPLANRLTCPDGSLVDGAYFFVGAEGAKNMPIGIAGPDLPEAVLATSYGDAVPLADAQAAAELARERGAYAFGVHTEADDISIASGTCPWTAWRYSISILPL